MINKPVEEPPVRRMKTVGMVLEVFVFQQHTHVSVTRDGLAHLVTRLGVHAMQQQ